MNNVIAGDYKGGFVVYSMGQIYLSIGWKATRVELDKFNVESYDVLDEKQRTSTTSAIVRTSIFGLPGALTVKKKGIYKIAVTFKDGKKSLLELNDKMYDAFIRAQY